MKLPISVISRYISLIAIVVFSMTGLANAQQDQIGYLGKGKDQYSVFIFGDALAGGLWAGSARLAPDHPKIKLNGRYREGSGLAKPKFYNWAERLPPTLESKNVDIAIVFIGTNDSQDMRRNGEYLVFNSEQWREVYSKAVETMMSQLTANKTAVYWVEVPPVSRKDLDERLKVVASIHKNLATKAGIRFVETRKIFTTPDGKFAINGTGIDGTVVRLRSRNGIRFIKSGNDKLASIVLEQIERDIAIADGDKQVKDFPVPDSSKIASNQDGDYTGPIFGSSSSDNVALIVIPQNMPVAGADQSTNVLVSVPTFGSRLSGSSPTADVSGVAALEQLKTQVSKDSTASSLFVDGVWPAAQSGRLDNFSQRSQ